IGKIARWVSPFLAMTGVGAPAAIGLGALGGGLEAADDDNTDTGVLGGIARGAAPAAAGAVGSKLLGGGAAAAGVAEPGSGEALYGIAPQGRGLGGRLLDWAKANPELAMNAAGTGLEAYGAHQEGQAMDRLADLREREINRDNTREDNLDDIIARLTRRVASPRLM
ncbi:MAG: hypothetical protein AB7T31_18260, partial [Gemmatimonadales bacterium]